jgi:hypothetical protein
MHLKGLRANGKQLGSTTWTWSSTYVINYFYYIYIICYYIDIFYLDPILKYPQRLSTFTRGGAYKVIPDAIELSKTLDPWPGYQYNTLCFQ